MVFNNMDYHNLPKPNKEAFEAVCNEIDRGNQLTFRHIGLVFGQAFWELMVLSLIDAKEATLVQLKDK